MVWYIILKEMEKKGSTRISITRKALKELEMKKKRKIRKVRKKTKFYSNKKQIQEITNTFKEELELRKITRKKIIEIERSKPEIKQRRQMIKY